MGIDIFSAKFLRNETSRGVLLGRMLTLGHQSVYMDRHLYTSLLRSLGKHCSDEGHADDLFFALGATTIDVMDASTYEGANIIHDLNVPVDAGLREKYDCVFDGGALEHVFNFPQAFKSCLEMVKLGGHFITITPFNNYAGHGFYQFSPELFYGALSELNGFSVKSMCFVYRKQWYSVRKPEDVGMRVEFISDEPALLFVSAQRTALKPVFQQWPQQSDYMQAWKSQDKAQSEQGRLLLKDKLVGALPGARVLQLRWRERKRRRITGPGNRSFFQPVELNWD